MKIKITFQERTIEHNFESEITNLQQVTQKLCSLFLLTNYYSYSLFLSSGQLVDNINLIDEGSEIIIKHLNRLGTISIGSGNNNSVIVTNNNNNNNGNNTTLPSSSSSININGQQIQQQLQQQVQLSPDTLINNLLNNLKDNTHKKKAFFDLKDLKEEILIRKFVEKNGIEVMVCQLKELTGNTLSYALSALQTIMSYEFSITSMTPTDTGSLITQLLPLTENTSNPSICKTSLSLLCLFLNQSNNLNFKQFSSTLVLEYNEKTKRNYNQTLVQLLSSSNTVDVQLNSLTLLNIIIGKTFILDGENGFNRLLKELDEYEINQKLKKLVESIIAPELKRQLYIYQRHRFQIITNRKNVTFNKESAEHDALLMKLWSLTYPGVKLESRVSEQWKQMGFQGTDPCTDFRAMGIWGLDNLIYFAQNHNEKFRKIVNSQIERKEREYPTATAGIVLTFELYNSIFKMGTPNLNPYTTPTDDLPFFPLFFSHPHAFEEVYCTTFQILDSTWDDMNGTYMHFQKIMSSVKNLIITALESKPTTLEAFDWKCQKNTKNSNGGSNSNQNSSSSSLLLSNFANGSSLLSLLNDLGSSSRDDMKKLLTSVNYEVLDLIKSQKISYFQEGFQFKLHKQLKTKQSLPLNWIFIRLFINGGSIGDNNQISSSSSSSSSFSYEVQYCFLPTELNQPPLPNQPIPTNYNTIKITDLHFNGESTNSNNKKKDKSLSYFNISIKDEQIQSLIQNQLPLSNLNNSNNGLQIDSSISNSIKDSNNSIKDSLSNNNNNNNSNNSNNVNMSSININNGGQLSPSTTSPILIPQQSQQSSLSIQQNSTPTPSSPVLLSSPSLHSTSSSSSNPNLFTIDLISSNRDDVSNFWDSIRLLSGQEIKSQEGLDDYHSLLSINTSVKLLDLDGIDIPKETPQIPILPDNFDFRSV
ncbi:hypothetical protein ACTFIU_005295 [Dictyostelium citrinum]